MNCPVCINPLENKKGKSIECPSCEYIACTKCIMTAMCVSKKVECINCRVGFTRRFVHSAFTTNKNRIAINKIHVDNIFKTQLDMARLEKPLVPLYKELDRLHARYEIAINAGADQDQLDEIIDPLIETVENKIDVMKGLLYDNNTKSRCIGCKDGVVFENHTQCQICKTDHCLKCYRESSGIHECLSEDLETLRAIKECSKKCPNCFVWISKIEGCDQMFCIECKTPFEWISGKVVKNEFFHNPHYDNYLENGGSSIFEPRDHHEVDPTGDCVFNLDDFNEHIGGSDKEYLRLRKIYKETERYMVLLRLEMENEALCNEASDEARRDFVMNEINERQFYDHTYCNYITLKEIEIMQDFLVIAIYTLCELLNAIFHEELSVSKGLHTIEVFIRQYIKPEFKNIVKMLFRSGTMSVYRWSIK